MKILRLYTSLHLWVAAAILAAMPVWADGELDTSFGTNGIVKIDFPNSSHGYLRDVAVVDGALEAAGFERGSGDTFCSTQFPDLFVVRLSLAGVVIGVPESHPQSAIQCPAVLIVDAATGDTFLAGTGSSAGGGATVVRFSSSGTLLASYVDLLKHEYGWSYCGGMRMHIDASGRVVVACGVRGEFGVRSMSLMGFSTKGAQLIPQRALTADFRAVGTSPRYFLRTWNALVQDPASGDFYVAGYACSQGGGSACLTSASAERTQYVGRFHAASLSLDAYYANGGVGTQLSVLAGDVFAMTIDGSVNVLIAGQYGTWVSPWETWTPRGNEFQPCGAPPRCGVSRSG